MARSYTVPARLYAILLEMAKAFRARRIITADALSAALADLRRNLIQEHHCAALLLEDLPSGGKARAIRLRREERSYFDVCVVGYPDITVRNYAQANGVTDPASGELLRWYLDWSSADVQRELERVFPWLSVTAQLGWIHNTLLMRWRVAYVNKPGQAAPDPPIPSVPPATGFLFDFGIDEQQPWTITIDRTHYLPGRSIIDVHSVIPSGDVLLARKGSQVVAGRVGGVWGLLAVEPRRFREFTPPQT